MSKEEIVKIVDQFINEQGLWIEFKAFVESQGYTAEELGFPKD